MTAMNRCRRAAMRRRGTSMLFLTGLSAVMILLAFGAADAALQGLKRSNRATDQAQVEWIARAGLAYARAHATELGAQAQPAMEREVGKGAFTVTAAKQPDGALVVAVEARHPAERPRATKTLRARMP